MEKEDDCPEEKDATGPDGAETATSHSHGCAWGLVGRFTLFTPPLASTRCRNLWLWVSSGSLTCRRGRVHAPEETQRACLCTAWTLLCYCSCLCALQLHLSSASSPSFIMRQHKMLPQCYRNSCFFQTAAENGLPAATQRHSWTQRVCKIGG